MFSVPAVHLDDGGLVPIGIGIRGRTTECLSPVSGESLDMLGVDVSMLLDRGADPSLGVPGDGNPLIMAASEVYASRAIASRRSSGTGDAMTTDSGAITA